MAKNTEENLIQKTVNVIDKNGYQDLSLRKLTKMIGLTTGAFYKHFTSKEDLFNIVTVELSEQFINSLHLDPNTPAIDQLEVIANHFIGQTATHPNIMDFLFFNSNTSFMNQNVELNDFPLVKTIALLSREANTGKVSDQEFFIQVWSFIQGYAQLVKNGITEYDPKLMRKTLISLTE